MKRLIVLLLVLSGCTTGSTGPDLTLIEINGWNLGVYERGGLTIVGPAETGWDTDINRYKIAALKAAEHVAGCEVADYEWSGYNLQAKMNC